MSVLASYNRVQRSFRQSSGVMYFSRNKRSLLAKASGLIALLLLSAFLLSQPWLTPWTPHWWLPSSLTSHARTSASFKLFYHLGGNGPWIPRAGNKNGESLTLPKHCSVDQVHMISRHAERYPTKNAGSRHFALLAKLKRSDVHLQGSLSFVDSWTYFANATEPEFEKLTHTGPYSGTLQAYSTGKKLRSRYHHLLKKDHLVNFWTCSSPRDIETAENFAQGFFGKAWKKESLAYLHVIPETAERGGDTLTPGDSCLDYRKDKLYGHDYGYAKLNEWQSVFAARIDARLREDAGGLDFTPLEIYGMMEMCGFEILARGSSSWCDVFSKEEWLEFEYARDLLHYYRAGPGNQYSKAMGFLWLNATQSLISNSSATGVYFSFAHDGDIIPLMATLGILDEDSVVQVLPTDHVKVDRRWKTSDVVPMGGRLVFEKITCGHTEKSSANTYIRLFINDGLINLEHVMGGSGLAGSVLLSSFEDWVFSKGQQFGDFREVCGLASESPAHISFLHQ